MSLMEEIVNNEDKIQNKTINDKCSRCGECCALFIPFTNSELEIIKQYVKKYNIKPTNRVNVLTNQFDAKCPFYNNIEKKCNIYEVRPYACRDFICSRKNWKDKRNEYGDKADYNSIGKTLASFDDLIYNDIEPIIRFIMALSMDETNQGDSNKFIKLIEHFNREDLLQYLTITDTDGNEYKGEDIKNCK